MLINNESVKKELEITAEQAEKIPEAVQKALAEVLNEKQMTRLRQIELQQRGNAAFLDARVKKELNLTEEQSESIKSILDEAAKERQEIFKEAKGGNFQGLQEKFTALEKETKEKLQGVLTPAQKKQWRAMIGDEFKMEFPGFNFGNKGKKKKDAE
ncbi:MAG: hypothetical protein NZO58_08370, partial [Gemmataceae bacterium]|nr:hypothetical protein [Gemmataceae bacterium]